MNGRDVRQQAIECVYAAIDETNRERGDDATPLEKSPDTPIHGTESALDSLGLVNFVVLAEESVERTFEKSITLGDDRALSREPSPYESVSTLADYIVMLLGERE